MIGGALRAVPVVLALAGGVGGDGLPAETMGSAPRHPQWLEVQWPFPIDQWGTGRAFRCQAEACGAAVTLYLRPKVGFCNCAKGVYDNAEIDRVGDMALLGPEFSGLGDSQQIAVGWMQGRSRVFSVSGPYEAPSAAAAIAFNDKCDVVVATVTADADLARGTQQALAFLNSDPVLRWARAELGSNGS
ncbi:MAG: hypothetical protein WAL80_17610 [Xanthobacteraceae bacterium]